MKLPVAREPSEVKDSSSILGPIEELDVYKQLVSESSELGIGSCKKAQLLSSVY